MILARQQIDQLVSKVKNSDSDIRFMGLTDFYGSLASASLAAGSAGGGDKGEIVCSTADFEGRLLPILMESLFDSNAEVQNVAVRSLVAVVAHLQADAQISLVIGRLCLGLSTAAAQEERRRDISAACLKSMAAAQLNDGSVRSASFVMIIVPCLLELSLSPASYEVLNELLDLWLDILSRFVSRVPRVSDVHALLVSLLVHSRPAIRKKASSALAALSLHLSDADLSVFSRSLVVNSRASLASNDQDFLKSQLSCYGSCARASGRKMASSFADMVEFLRVLIARCVSSADGDDGGELIETCLWCLDQMVRGFAGALESDLASISDMAVSCLKYDPNYAAFDDESDSHNTKMDEDLGDGEDDNEDFDQAFEDDEDDDLTDDDDVSWKVRRAAALLLKSIFESFPDSLTFFLAHVSPKLIERFAEREESVRLDVLAAFNALLKEMSFITGLGQAAERDEPAIVALPTARGNAKKRKTTISVDDMDFLDSSPFGVLKGQLGRLCKRLQHSLARKTKIVAVSQSCYSILTQCIRICQCDMDEYAAAFFILSESTLRDSGSPLKLDILEFLRTSMKCLSSDALLPFATKIGAVLVSLSNDQFHRVVKESLKAMGDLICTMRPVDTLSRALPSELTGTLKLFLQITMQKTRSADSDLEVKESALSSLATIWYQAGDELLKVGISNSELLTLLMDYLRNETTRTMAIMGFMKISSSPLGGSVTDLSQIIGPLFSELSLFLRKDNRNLRLATLQLQLVLMQRYSAQINSAHIGALLGDIGPLISDADLNVLTFCLRIISSLIVSSPSHHSSIHSGLQEQLLPSVVALIGSHVLFDCTPVLDEIVLLLENWLTAFPEDFDTFSKLIVKPIANVGVDLTMLAAKNQSQIFSSNSLALRARAIVAIIASPTSKEVERVALVRKFIDCVAESATLKPKLKQSEPYLLLSLTTLGTFACISNGKYALQELVVNDATFKSFHWYMESEAAATKSEELRLLAAQAMGLYLTGNLKQFLPPIIEELRKSSDKRTRHLLLHSLNSLIGFYAANQDRVNDLRPLMDELWSTMLSNGGSTPNLASPTSESMQDISSPELEENSTVILAECLGKLAMMNPMTYLSKLQSQLKSNSSQTRRMVISAVKYTLASEHLTHELDDLIKPLVDDFISAITADQDLNVRWSALSALNNLLHNKPNVARDKISTIMPHIFAATQVREDLIVVVEMGPFKHKVDNGLNIRKTAYECMYTVLNTHSLFAKVQSVELLESAIKALSDPAPEILSLSHLILVKVSKMMNEKSAASTSTSAALIHGILEKPEIMTALHSSMKAAILSPPNASAVKQELEKQAELANSALKALIIFSAACSVVQSTTWPIKVAAVESVPPHFYPLQQLWTDIMASPTASQAANDVSRDLLHL